MMKKIIYVGLTGLLISCVVSSCKKEIEESYVSILKEESVDKKEEGLEYIEEKEVRELLSTAKQQKLIGIGEWIRNHTGRHSRSGFDCGGGGACGPCPAICFSFGIHEDNLDADGKLEKNELEEGYRLFSVKRIAGNNENLVITFTDNKLQHDGSYLYIDEDVYFDTVVAKKMGVNMIKIIKGAYPVVYDYSPEGETVVRAEIK